MRDRAYIFVKVGGSLYDLPELCERLRIFLHSLPPCPVVLVPGGGAAADAVRHLDRVHHLGEEAAHWLAIQSLSLNAAFLKSLFPEASMMAARPRHGLEKSGTRLEILDPLPFFHADEALPDHLPHRWDVTSDSLAVRAAKLCQASELILLKSTDWAGSDWSQAQRGKIVDDFFLEALKQAPSELRVRIVNLRSFFEPGRLE